MLMACGVCGRQYDVTHVPVGKAVRCECGVSNIVEEQVAHAPRPLRCSSCGGQLEDKARQCGFCGAEVTLEERQLSEVCPACFARMARGAAYCMECGVTIQVQQVTSLADDVTCPRCEGALRSRRVDPTTQVVECSHCAGLWLSPRCFEQLCEKAGREGPAQGVTERVDPPRQPVTETIRYLPCMVCGDLMNRRNFGRVSGVIIDVCKDHGIWLDHRELEKILEFVRSGGLQKMRQDDIRHLEEQTRRLEARRAAGSSGSSLDLDWERTELPVLGALSWLVRRFLRS